MGPGAGQRGLVSCQLCSGKREQTSHSCYKRLSHYHIMSSLLHYATLSRGGYISVFLEKYVFLKGECNVGRRVLYI